MVLMAGQGLEVEVVQMNLSRKGIDGVFLPIEVLFTEGIRMTVAVNEKSGGTLSANQGVIVKIWDERGGGIWEAYLKAGGDAIPWILRTPDVLSREEGGLAPPENASQTEVAILPGGVSRGEPRAEEVVEKAFVEPVVYSTLGLLDLGSPSFAILDKSRFGALMVATLKAQGQIYSDEGDFYDELPLGLRSEFVVFGLAMGVGDLQFYNFVGGHLVDLRPYTRALPMPSVDPSDVRSIQKSRIISGLIARDEKSAFMAEWEGTLGKFALKVCGLDVSAKVAFLSQDLECCPWANSAEAKLTREEVFKSGSTRDHGGTFAQGHLVTGIWNTTLDSLRKSVDDFLFELIIPHKDGRARSRASLLGFRDEEMGPKVLWVATAREVLQRYVDGAKERFAQMMGSRVCHPGGDL
jgi:hypothetical protein